MPLEKYGKRGGKIVSRSGVYNEPKVIKNLYGYFQKMESENQVSNRETSPEGIKRANKERFKKIFRIKMGREAPF